MLVVWGVSGLTMMLLMSGMQAIPSDVYESAELDGASWWQQERQVTLPMLRRTIAMSLIISVIGSFLAFTQFYILTQGGPGSETTTVVMSIYKRAFVQLQLGAATALSLVLVVVIGLVTAAQFWLLREKDDMATTSIRRQLPLVSARRRRGRRVLYVVGGGGALLVFTVPLLWALLRSRAAERRDRRGAGPGDLLPTSPSTTSAR